MSDASPRFILEQHREWLGSGGRAGRQASLNGAVLAGGDFRGAKLARADLRGANLAGADSKAAVPRSLPVAVQFTRFDVAVRPRRLGSDVQPHCPRRLGRRRMRGRRWRIAAASVIGTSHLKQGSVCQDSHACRMMEDANGRTVAVLVASDGAGSASRADEGSFLACRTVQEAVEVYLANGGQIADIDLGTIRSWVNMVQRAITFRAEKEGMVPRDYACTLLAAFVGEDAAAFLQIGDGAIVVSDQASEWAWVYWPQRGEFANAT